MVTESKRPGPRGARSDLFAPTLRAAIEARGLSLERVRYHLKHRGHELSVATLSYWQSGRSIPDRASSLAALGSLEETLELPPGALVSLLPTRARRPGAAARAMQTDGLPGDTGTMIDEAIEAFGLHWDDIEHVAIHDLLTLLADRTVGSHQIREIIRAERAPVTRFVAAYWDDPKSSPYIMARHNCRLGRVIEHPDVGLVIAELLLDVPLDRGEVRLVEYEYATVGQGPPCDHWERGMVHTLREVHLELEFTPPALPVAVEARLALDGQDRTEPVQLIGNLATLLRLDAGPGTVGLSWTW